MFKSWSLKKKLVSSYLVTIALFGGVIIFAIHGMGKMSALSEDMYLNNLQPIVLVANGNMEAIYQDRSLYDLVIETDAKKMEKIHATIKKHKQKQDDYIKQYLMTDLSPKEKELMEKFNQAWPVYDELAKKVIAFKLEGKHKEALDVLNGPAMEKFQIVDDLLSDLVNVNVSLAETSHKTTAEISSQTKWVANLLGITVFAGVFIFALWFAKLIGNQIRQITERLSSGANEVSSASMEISSTGEQLSSAASEQAAALQETVASVDEINAMVAKNAEGAQRSQQIANSSQQSTMEGQESVKQMIRSIDEISQSNGEIVAQIEHINQEMSEVVNLIQEIGQKTKVINDIVFQTKLLSFNASVEAARAGEHGKGFAVVAEEVGNLAAMSGNAAKEISAMLSGSTQKVQQIVQDAENKVKALVALGKEKVDAGTSTARQCGEILEKIVRDVGEVSQVVAEIANASNEQARGVQEITKAMGQMDQTTQENAQAAQKSSSASQSLTRQASDLRQMVELLVATVEGVQSSTGSHGASYQSSEKGNTVQFHAKPRTETKGRVA